MNESIMNTVVKQLIDNTNEIICSAADGTPDNLLALAHTQKHLTQAMKLAAGQGGISPETARELLVLVGEALSALRIKMGQNRGSMQVTGIKKKVLRAYGKVTVSSPPAG